MGGAKLKTKYQQTNLSEKQNKKATTSSNRAKEWSPNSSPEQ